MLKKVFCLALLLCTISVSCLAAASRWDGLLERYKNEPSVRQLVFVRHTGDSRCKVVLYAKDKKEKAGWRALLTCDAILGANGLGKQREGDMKTPIGVYGYITAAGFADNPGTRLPYLKMDEHTFCSEDPRYYNRLQDDRKVPIPEDVDYMMDGAFISFTYALQLDYNRENIPGRGSYIFLHCLPPASERQETSGCVAMRIEDMRFILQQLEPGALVCIYPW